MNEIYGYLFWLLNSLDKNISYYKKKKKEKNIIILFNIYFFCFL